MNIRQRRYVVSDAARSTLPAVPLKPTTNEAQHLVTLSSVEDDALGEELQVIWELEPGASVIEKIALPEPNVDGLIRQHASSLTDACRSDDRPRGPPRNS